MSNITFMDDDTFSNFEVQNGTYEENWYGEDSIFYHILYILTEIIKLLVCLCSTGASIFLIYVMSKFERLRTKTNVFFLHYAIACCIDMTMIPLFMIIHEFFVSHWIFLCVAYDGSSATTVMIFIFATAISVYWFLQTFKTEWLQNCQHFQLIFTVALYIFCLIKFGVCITKCFLVNVDLRDYLVTAVYISLLGITIAICVFTYKHGLNDVQRKTQYQLFISTYIILSYFPLFMFSEIVSLMRYELSSLIDYICMLIFSINEIVAYSGPIIVVYLLGQRNKYFKAAYNKVLKRSVRNYEDEFDEDSEHTHGEQDSNQTTPSNGLVNNSVFSV